MSHDYSNLGNVPAGEKDPNVIREIVREIRRKAEGLMNGRESSYDPGGLTDRFGWFGGSSALSPYYYEPDAQPT